MTKEIYRQVLVVSLFLLDVVYALVGGIVVLLLLYLVYE